MRFDNLIKVVQTSPFEKRINNKQYERVGIIEPYICTSCNKVWQNAGESGDYMEYIFDFPKRGCSKKICKRCNS